MNMCSKGYNYYLQCICTTSNTMNMIFSPVYVYKLYIYIYIYLSTTRLQYSKYISNIYTFSLLIKNETIFEKKTKDIYIISIHIFNVKMFFFKCTYTLLVEFNFMVMDLMMSVFRSFYVYQCSRNMVPLALI